MKNKKLLDLLLSSKTFFVEVSTGDVSVLKNSTVGICKIETSTGDIYITIV